MGENMKEIVTANLTYFGYRERKEAERLLSSWNTTGLPKEFEDDEVQIFMNRTSGYVFLSNSEFQVAMMNGDELEIFYTDFETGEEGFKDELSEEALMRLELTAEEEE
jgi:PBP1b-binding outer membrane lipoprotein LpoB